MKQIIAAIVLSLGFGLAAMGQTNTVTLKIVETSDVHGSFFPYDFINRKPVAGSMARVSSYVRQLRSEYGDRVILINNGDILQRQPTSYYYK